MSRAFDHYIHQQLEPNDIIRMGKAKRETSTIFEKWKQIDDDRAADLEGFLNKEKEYQDWKQQNYESNNF